MQQIKEQQQAIESARASVLGFKGDIEREKQAMQVCPCGVASRPPALAVAACFRTRLNGSVVLLHCRKRSRAQRQHSRL